jgi:lysophospholipase L1-like esterase
MTQFTDQQEYLRVWHEGHYDRQVLVEGDSWVSYPFLKNLARQFDAPGTLMLNLASTGDEARRILQPGSPQFRTLRRLLHTRRFGYNFDLIFLSLGGNDIVGPEIRTHGFVHDKRECPHLVGRELLTPRFYETVSGIARGYTHFLKLRDRSDLNPHTPVVTHVYSYLRPRKVGTRLGPLMFGEGWIQVYLEQLRVRESAEQRDIIQGMVDALYRHLRPLEDQFSRFVVVDTRRVLSRNGRPRTAWWKDEIHPRSKGFERLARHIRRVARVRGCWSD